ncbi:MAG TPA: hypothetical protein VE954_35525 [Oligoflexus sp.]|uniref:hypothetical protein n=1 Tax=Oligoflexus sp. TaxID=1971216 RepID=UPI002D2A1CB7|nr:hypothetical protein [Oligoflexus sp.]HYX38444.1 hypothetical protein [Oligoflexus sp.]
MLRFSGLLLIALSMTLSFACKKKQATTPTQSLTPELQGKPDKVSEEPTGLPGYPLLCRWVQGPARDTLDASLSCFLGDDQGRPANISEKLSWNVSVPANGTLLQEVKPDQSLLLTVKSSSRDQLDLALLNMQLKTTIKSQERTATGRDLLKADSKKLRLAASCKDFFTLLFVNDLGAFSYFEMNRFTGCEQLATTLQNAVVPNGQSRSLPDVHKTVQASCGGGSFILSINQPEFQGNSSQSPIDNDACEDLRGLVNNLGL